ncbi:glycine cleavage system aminomethyltransferase GcvT [Limibaculum sp. M0105]|uniref:aminomethyltransferase n=1 Tax=Thermohalobaculum xanthum TaxID=2753746 RepID=A0A8J7SFB0_9RHOB|nr:glycine cleavage system aminomethyltransferase GcvT [Thermohalobaculum xanthum]MBK0399432.1 glycine cleavage system aminomethyltransferase GcvT [Thermohalobaculum xanthum]
MTDTDEGLPTPLTELHRRLGAKLVPFAGYQMPLNYPAGIMAEHQHCRAKAGLFDVSHMGQIVVTARSGDTSDAARALERLVPVDILGLGVGRQRYALFTDDNGGILDDLMVANLGDRLVLVVNAACKAADFAHLQQGLGADCQVSMLTDRALVALQGPEAGNVLAGLAPDTAQMRFMDVREVEILGLPCLVSRSGYTGEDGFEISVPDHGAMRLAEALLADPAVEPIGLGARDSLRLEAGLCLYGNDIDRGTTPVEAGLTWAIQKARRTGGAREGGFPGAARILAELDAEPARLRVGLLPEGRAPVRGGAPLFAAEEGGDSIGIVTSGGFGPSLGAPVAMGYVPAGLAAEGTRVFAEVRGRRLALSVAPMPFVPNGYKKS